MHWWRNGIRSGLRSQSGNRCGFKSHPVHQQKNAAVVAQLDRAQAPEAWGWEFKSPRSHQIRLNVVIKLTAFFIFSTNG